MSSKVSLLLTIMFFGVNYAALSAANIKEPRASLTAGPSVAAKQFISAAATGSGAVSKTTTKPSATMAASAASSLTQNTSANTPVASVKSFKEWKNEKVQSAIKKVTITKAQIEYKRLNKQIFRKTEAGLGKDIDIEKLEAQLKTDMFSLEAAQLLGVQDYFAIYLTKLDNKNEAFKEAALKMNSEEVAELINAFADSMVGSQGAPVTAPAATAENYEDKVK